MRKVNSSGFGVVEVLLVLVAVGLIGGAGWYVWSRNAATPAPVSSVAPTATPTPTPADGEAELVDKLDIELLSGRVGINLGDSWKKATGGYYSVDRESCGQSVTSSVKCVDHVMLIPVDETFTDADQFQVNIGVFEKKDSASANDWYTNDVYQGVSASEKSRIAFRSGNLTGIKITEDYTSDAGKNIRLAYVFAGEGYGVVVRTSMFSGNHYGFEGSKDYTTYESAIDELVKGLMFNE